MYDVKSIAINNLLLDIQNPRYNDLSNQREIIQQILIDQDRKLLNLATDIVQYTVN